MADRKGAGHPCRAREFNFKLSGNDVSRTHASLSLTKIMLCSKRHCRTVFEWKVFSYQIERRRVILAERADFGAHIARVNSPTPNSYTNKPPDIPSKEHAV